VPPLGAVSLLVAGGGLDGFVDGAMLLPLDGGGLAGLVRLTELELLLPEPVLAPGLVSSQAASDRADRIAAGMSHFLSMESSPFGLRLRITGR
jgi:hypothetical protein